MMRNAGHVQTAIAATVGGTTRCARRRSLRPASVRLRSYWFMSPCNAAAAWPRPATDRRRPAVAMKTDAPRHPRIRQAKVIRNGTCASGHRRNGPLLDGER